MSFANSVSVGTAVLNFSVVLNESFWDSPVDRVFVELDGDEVILDILGLKGDGQDGQDLESVSLSETEGVIELSIYYTMAPPNSATYPYDFNLTVNILVVGLAFGNFHINNNENRLIHGKITLPPGIIVQ